MGMHLGMNLRGGQRVARQRILIQHAVFQDSLFEGGQNGLDGQPCPLEAWLAAMAVGPSAGPERDIGSMLKVITYETP